MAEAAPVPDEGSILSQAAEASDLAVVIPTQNRWDVLEHTIDGLGRQTAGGFETVVVVDEGARPPGFLNGTRVVERHRRGVGAARNAGVGSTERRLIMFLGDDTIPERHLVARHLALHGRHPEREVGVLGAVHWHPEVARGRIQQWLDWSGTQFDYGTIVGQEAGWGRLYSSNVSLKRDFFVAVGGFDEAFLFGYEDIELGLRLHDVGLRLLYEPAAEVSHLHRYDWRAIERRFLLVGGGEYLMVRRHPGFDPFFLRKFLHRPRVGRVSAWPAVVDRVPRSMPRLRRQAERRADAWYSKQLAPMLVAGWLAAEDLDEAGRLGEDGLYEALAQERLAELRSLGALLPLVRPGSRIVCVGCSGRATRELRSAGYDVSSSDGTGFVADGDHHVVVVLSADSAEPGSDVLDAAERSGAVVAAVVGHATGGPLLRRARRRGVILTQALSPDAMLVVYRGTRSQTRKALAHHPARIAAGTQLRRVLRRPRPPWLPPSSSGALR